MMDHTDRSLLDSLHRRLSDWNPNVEKWVAVASAAWDAWVVLGVGPASPSVLVGLLA